MEAQIFKALGDPIRLEMVQRLSSGSSYTLGDLTKNLGISRQGARRQLQVLELAQVVHLRPSGREVKVALDINSLKESKAFIVSLERQWDKRLHKLKNFVEKD